MASLLKIYYNQDQNDYTIRSSAKNILLPSGETIRRGKRLLGFRLVQANNISASPKHIEEKYIDYMGHESGIYEKVFTNEKLRQAVAAPSAYLNSKNVDLVQINSKLSMIYNDDFSFYINQGYTPKRAKQEALKNVELVKKQEMYEHNNRFPKKIVDEAMRRLKKFD